MTTTQASIVFRQLRGLAAAGAVTGMGDRQLLERFISQREEAAFEALVRRHGSMVLGVCRRILGNRHDAEDAFQATFLVLAHKAGDISRRDSVGGWLYQVAYNMALKAKASAAARQRRESAEPRSAERAPAPHPTPDPLDEVTGRELLAILNEELHRLPDRYRTPLILCYLESKTRDEAARQLGQTVATLKRRLEQGRELLRARLERRGVSLTTALAAVGLSVAVVPQALATATVGTARLYIAGNTLVLSSQIVQLMEQSLSAMTAGKWKAIGIIILLLSFIGGGWGAGAWSGDQPQREPTPQRERAGAWAGDQPQRESMTVSGRVVDPNGKVAAEAAVMVLARQGMLLSSWQGWAVHQNDLVSRTKTDAEGRFRLTVPRTDKLMTVRQVRVLATFPHHGLAWKALDPEAERAEVELRLTTEQLVRGRIVGIQGEPAVGVTIHVDRITRAAEKDEKEGDAAVRPPAALRVAATTDAKGEFVFIGFGPNLTLELEIRDPRYQRKTEWNVSTADKKQCENLRLVLPPGQLVEGRVIFADTGKPVPHARMMIANPVIDTDADAEGRFRVSIGPATEIAVYAYAPPGEPYLRAHQVATYPKGVVRREVEIALPRAVLVSGKITETGGGKPVAGAYVEYVRDGEPIGIEHGVWSGPDGTYKIGAPAGAGRITATHPSGEYVAQVVGSGGRSLDKPIGDPSYYHAVIPVDIKSEDKVKEVNVALRPGATIKGRLVGPDDKPVSSAVLFVSSHRPRSEKTMHPVHVRDGHFEVRGCDPEKRYQLLFLEHPRLPPMHMMAEGLQTFGQLWLSALINGKDSRGASLEICPKNVTSDPVVRVAPCGTAKLQFVDAAGKPKADFVPWLQLIVPPGPPLWKAIEDKTLAAEVVSLAGPYGDQPPGQPKTDAKGYVSYTGLIPGATYRVKVHGAGLRNDVLKDFTVEAGKTAELEIVVK